MDLFSRFKKDYFNYLASIILPAFIAGIAVPVLKNLLGPKGYGDFAIYFNAALIGSAITTGWITQSIYRFYSSADDKNLFAKLTISISAKTQLLLFLPVLIVVWYLKSDLLLGIVICMSIFMNSMQFTYLSIAQASFLSRKTIYSETIRSVSYILIAIIFLMIAPHNYLYILFCAIIISYTLSVGYLRNQTKQFFLANNAKDVIGITEGKLIRKFFKYGAPLSLWVVVANLLPYIDKLLMLHYWGGTAQGNYQAIFDFLYKGITVLISPIIISLLPLLAEAYKKIEVAEIRKVMKKIILFELVSFFLSSIFYWWFGANLLFIILKIPNIPTYRLMGFIVLAGTFIWQLAIVVHQRYVLKLRSLYLLYCMIIAFLSEVIFYLIAGKLGNPLVFPLGYLIAAAAYLFLVSMSVLPVVLKSFFTQIKSLFYKFNFRT